MRDFARINVYIADSNVLKTEESVDYNELQLLSDIGGQLGLWVGISVITLAEMFELVVDIIKYIFRRGGPHSKGKNFSVDPKTHEKGVTRRRTGRRRSDRSCQSCQASLLERQRNPCDTNGILEPRGNDASKPGPVLSLNGVAQILPRMHQNCCEEGDSRGQEIKALKTSASDGFCCC